MMRIIIPVLLFLLTGCTSVGGGQVKQYYLLEPSSAAKNSTIDGTPIMSIRRVRLPDYISENKGIVRRDGTGKIRISSLHNWAEHLDTTVPHILAMELSTQLNRPVDLHPIPVGYAMPYILEVDVLNMLGGYEEHRATFEFQAKYRIIDEQHHHSVKSYRFNTTFDLADDKASTLAKGYSQALQALAKDIAKQIK